MSNQFLFLLLVAIMMTETKHSPSHCNNDENCFLKQQLTELFTHYHAPDKRYRHTAFSSKDPVLLDELIGALRNELGDYTIWHGYQPESNISPLSGCSRLHFIQQVFTSDLAGLIICFPEHWLRHWSTADKQAFWSALSTRHGGHNVIVVFLENAEFGQINQH